MQKFKIWLQSQKTHQMSWPALIAGTLIIFAITALLFFPIHNARVAAESDRKKNEAEWNRLANEARKLEDTLKDMETSSYDVSRVRRELGMGFPNEIIFTVEDANKLENYTQEEWAVILAELSRDE